MTKTIASSRQAQLTIIAAACIQFIVSMDTFILNVALPTIITTLHGNAVTQQWTLDAYTLAFASPLLLMGSLTDRFGARRLFAIGIAGFGLSSLLCALSINMEMLILGRALLGVCAAAAVPASMALIKEAYPDATKRAKALGVWMSAGAIAGGIGPLVGGLLTPIHWSLVFTINIPVCVLGLCFMPFLKKSATTTASFDPLGQILSTIGIVLIVAAIIEGAEWGYLDLRVVGMFCVGLLLVALFIYWESKAKTPMMPLKLFKTAAMKIADFAGFCFIFTWFGAVFVCCTYVQNFQGGTPFEAGLLFVPASILAFFGNIMAGRLTAKYGPRLPMAVGFAASVASCAVLGIVGVTLPSLPYMLLMCALPFVVYGGAITMPAASSVVLTNTTNELAGIASGAFNTFRQIGASVGIAIYGAVLTSLTLHPSAAVGICFVIGAVLNLIVLIMCRALPNKPLK